MIGTLAALAVAGGLGAAARYGLSLLISSRFPLQVPLATIVVNLSGCLLLGFLTGLAAASAIAPATVLVAGTGFLGGYTTFSTASVDTVRLLRSGRAMLALASGVGTLLGALAAAALGFWLAVSA